MKYFLLCLLVLSSISGFSSADDEIVQGYPGGDYGMDLGKGYEVMPDGQLLEPRGYREDYKNTKYGPMTRDGFLLFPQFHFSDSKKMTEKKEKKEEKDKEKEKIFEKAMQEEGETGSSLWGFSGPVAGPSKEAK